MAKIKISIRKELIAEYTDYDFKAFVEK